MKHPITQSKNDKEIYVDLIHSLAAVHIAQNPHLLSLLKEILSSMSLTKPEYYFEKDMGRVIGSAYVVETSEKDSIIYAQRVREQAYTRFVKNIKPDSCQFLTILLRRDGEGLYELKDTWIGRLNPPLPGNPSENESSRGYWANHAFVFEGEAIQSRSITKVCPY